MPKQRGECRTEKEKKRIKWSVCLATSRVESENSNAEPFETPLGKEQQKPGTGLQQ
jgi:hypothetical protein